MRIALVFPGQGSQSVGMLDTVKDELVVQQMLEDADEVLGEPLSQLIAEGPAETLGLTVNTQPALVTASVAFYALWKIKGGPTPVVAAGHSLGEYSALTAAASLDFMEAVALVRKRAQAMQEAVPEGLGKMAAVIGLSDEDVLAAVDEARGEDVLDAVNFNSPGQVVVAGHTQAIERLEATAKARGARRVMVLNVSAPFHSALMAPAAEKLEDVLRTVDVNVPSFPVLSNVDAEPESAPNDIRRRLAAQAKSPVQWVKTVEKFVEMGVTDVVEMGPGKVLTGLIKRINPDLRTHNVNSLASLNDVLATLRAADVQQ